MREAGLHSFGGREHRPTAPYTVLSPTGQDKNMRGEKLKGKKYEGGKYAQILKLEGEIAHSAPPSCQNTHRRRRELLTPPYATALSPIKSSTVRGGRSVVPFWWLSPSAAIQCLAQSPEQYGNSYSGVPGRNIFATISAISEQVS